MVMGTGGIAREIQPTAAEDDWPDKRLTLFAQKKIFLNTLAYETFLSAEAMNTFLQGVSETRGMNQ